MEIINSIGGVNWLAVIVVTILSFMLGGFWHSPVLFGKTWTKEINFDRNKQVNVKILFGLSAFAHFGAVVFLASTIGAQASAINGLINGLIISIFWISTSIGVTYLFAARSFKLFLIDAGFYVVFFSLAGLILGAWH
jgi:hypothetical protein